MSQEIPKKVCNSCFYKLPATEFRHNICRTCENWKATKLRSKECKRCNKNKPFTAYMNIMNEDNTICDKLGITCIGCYQEKARKHRIKERSEETRNLAHFSKFVMK